MATDLDGTLLRNDGGISDRTRRTLRRLREREIHLVLVSARTPRTLRPIARRIGVGGLAICLNGALVFDLDEEQIVHHSPMPEGLALEIIGRLREAVPGVCFAVEIGIENGWEPAFGELSNQSGPPPAFQDHALSLCRAPVSKILIRHPTMSGDALLAQTHEYAGDLAHFTHSGAPFVEVSAPGVDKAATLEALCTRLGVHVMEVVAFGDMPNDLPMLRWAGRGVAVANAHPDVLLATSETTLSNDEDGVAVFLEQIFWKG